jgi:hypothetical protein
MTYNFIKSVPIKKILYLSFFLLIFSQIFIHNAFDDWENKYRTFSVPAQNVPGGDARNIQKTAFCHSQGYAYYSDNECYKNSTIITDFYPDSQATPKYNYPPIVAKVYEFFNNYSEDFFQKFWFFNTLILIITILVYSYKFNYLLFPFIAFSPVTLLAIERGNIDAITFSILFLPLVLTASVFLHIIFIGFATTIKLFPIVSYLALYKKNFTDIKKKSVALILILPLIVYSVLSIQEYTKSTSYGFGAAFGLFSLKNAPFFSNHLLLSYLGIILYLLFTFILVFSISRNKHLIKPLILNIKKIKKSQLNILLISLIIYSSVFMVFTNWGYRFIFLIPAFLILSNFKDIISRISFGLIFIILWIPWMPYGWSFFNLLNYALFPWIIIIFIFSYKYHFFDQK